MKEINLKMTSVVVEAKTRPLRSKWTRQMASELAKMNVDPYYRRAYRMESIINIFNIEKHDN